MSRNLVIRPYFDGTNSYRIVENDEQQSINYFVNHIILPNSCEKNKSVISYESRLTDRRYVISNGLVSVMADKDVRIKLLDNGIIAFYTEKAIVFSLDLISFKKYELPKDLDGYITKLTESHIVLNCGTIAFSLEIDFTNSILPFKFTPDYIKLK